MGAASGEQCRGACSEILPEEIKEAAPRRVRDVGVVRVERLLGHADRLEALVFRRLVGVGLVADVHEPVAHFFVNFDGIVLVARLRKLLLELRGRGRIREAAELVKLSARPEYGLRRRRRGVEAAASVVGL